MMEAKKAKKIDKDLIFCLLGIALPLLQFIIFYIVVNFNSFFLAFKSYDKLTGEYSWVQWSNFARVWSELTESTLLRDALKYSVIVWFFTSLVGTVLAVVFSYYIYKKVFGGKVFKIILFLPSILPAILLSCIFRIFANEALPQYLNEWFGINGISEGLLINQNTRFPTVIFYTVWISFGTQILLYSGSMEQVDPSIIEAGKLDGASPLVELWYLVIPEVLPAISTFLITGIAQLFVNQANLYNFYGQAALDSYRMNTVGYYMFYLINDTAAGISNYPYASALGLCCTFVAVPLTFIVRKLLNKMEEV